MITCNVNKSSAQCQANVVIFQETQDRQDAGTAEELGWTLLKELKDGTAAIAVKRKNRNRLRHSRRSTRWVLVIPGSILFISMYLPHTWFGETNQEEYYKTLKDLDKNMQDVKQKYHISGITVWMDAQVEVKPNPPSFVGGGTRVSRGNAAKYCELESKFRRLLMEWITKHEVKLSNTFCRNWEPTRAKTNKLDLWEQDEVQQQKWEIIAYIAVPIS